MTFSERVLELTYTCRDDWARPVYKDQFGKLWKDVELGDRLVPSLYSSSNNAFDGEPDYPINGNFIIIKPFVKNPKENKILGVNQNG